MHVSFKGKKTNKSCLKLLFIFVAFYLLFGGGWGRVSGPQEKQIFPCEVRYFEGYLLNCSIIKLKMLILSF